MVLFGVKQTEVPEIKLRYNRSTRKPLLGKITSSREAADFIRSTYKRGEIEMQEHFVVLYLNRGNKIMGYYRHATGGIAGVVADIRIILAGALKSLCTSIVIAHNHPSGNLRPSDADIKLTKSLKSAAETMEITLLDHIIMTKDSYTSLADEGLMGLPEPGIGNPEEELAKWVETSLANGISQSRMAIEKEAARLGITDKTIVKELTELAIVRVARGIALNQNQSQEQRFRSIVELYQRQANLSFRTSQSILLQQYSTPAPIALLAGIFCGVDKFTENQLAFEPSAGNGLLTIAGRPEHFIVNEIDYTRNRNLHTQPYRQVTSRDASNAFDGNYHRFDAVLTNPPFGRLDHRNTAVFHGFRFRELDHVMAAHALSCLKDNGRAAIIIGGHTLWDEKGRVQAGKNRIFLNYLYHRYHVADIIQVDGQKLYSRQGTSFDVRLILIAGRKANAEGAAPLYDMFRDVKVRTFAELYDRVLKAMAWADQIRPKGAIDLTDLVHRARKLHNTLVSSSLEGPYNPASQACIKLDTQVPDSMDFEIHTALNRVKDAVGGDMDNFVRHRLGYRTKLELCRALSAEQIDAVALSIYNIEARNEGIVIGDQTGIGKGRIAAAMIRYAKEQGLIPVFITEKPNLFSDIYRDLKAIGSGRFKPFIVNARESKTDIKDEDGIVIYQAPTADQQKIIFNEPERLASYDFVVATYSQFNSAEKKPEKPDFLLRIAGRSLLILDESHNASGSSNTGEFLTEVVRRSRGVVFLSATFAKRPDNMPIYAMKTAIKEANMSKSSLVDAINRGGVAMQEILSSQLVAEGQMIRRERSFEGVEVNYIHLDQLRSEHEAIADNITGIIRDIIAFQENHIAPVVEQLDTMAANLSKEIELRAGTKQAGVDNLPYFSKVFNVINQMLFSIKAEAVAAHAIERLREGKKPVIAFASTMGSFIEQMENQQGEPVSDGDLIRADFSEVLRKGLNGVMRYTERDIDGIGIHKTFDLTKLSGEAQMDYYSIRNKIDTVSTGISISPIDIIINRIEAAGYTVAEVTGRKYSLQLNEKTGMGIVRTRKRENTNDAFRRFNDNEVDTLLINQSGSTGASAHAVTTRKVTVEQLKQRVMCVLQPELDINTEVQKRGRINRTGQLLKPIYDYLISAIPAEKRLMMMLQKKLKSLDANTTSNQRQSKAILDVPDFLNKYGDKIVKEYLTENPKINKLLGDPMEIETSKGSKGKVSRQEDLEARSENMEKKKGIENLAHKVSGRVAVLSVKMQEDFYNEIIERYNDYVEYLKQVDDYDLEVDVLNLQAETTLSDIRKMGKGGMSAFGNDSIMERVTANVLKKPFRRHELQNLVNDALKGRDPQDVQREMIGGFEVFHEHRYNESIEKLERRYDRIIDELGSSYSLNLLLKKHGVDAYNEKLEELRTLYRQERDKEIKWEKQHLTNQRDFITRIMRFFEIGRPLKYPAMSFGGGLESIFGISLGIEIDYRRKNPYAPSRIKVRIAIASGLKYVSLPMSFQRELTEIMGASIGMPEHFHPGVYDDWEAATKERQADRQTRFIITGNLLQAFGDEKGGKLISYTTHDGETKKGILLPEYWEPPKLEAKSVTVPVAYASRFIKSQVWGTLIRTNDSVSLIREQGQLKIIVPGSREQGGEIFLDQELWPLIVNGRFEKVSTNMSAIVLDKDLDHFLILLQENHNVSIDVNASDFHLIERKSSLHKLHQIALPPPEEETPVIPINLIEIRARALKLKMQLKLAA